MTLLDVVVAARERGEDPDLALFKATATADIRRAAWLLAASLALPPSDLAVLLGELWSEIDAPAAVESIGESPLVEHGADGWKLTAAFSGLVADDFRDSDRPAWSRAHRLLAGREQAAARELGESAVAGRWFAEARVAYHLAAYDPVESVRRFGEIFGNPPHSNPDGARRWLISLVRKQDAQLASQPRERAFFHGYDVYTMGVATQAVAYMTPVYEAGTDDAYAALALYVAGVSTGQGRPQEGLQLLQSSVELSEQLNLLEPEIRARHSFVWTIFGLINSESPDPASRDRLLRAASDAAHLNARRAELYGSRLLIARSAWTTIVADWLVALASRSDDTDQLTTDGLRAVGGLVDVRRDLLAHGDPRAAVLTTRNAMSILADVGLVDQAIDQGDAAVELARSFEAPAALGRVEAEAKRLLGRADQYQRERIDSLLGEIRALVGAARP